MCNIILVLVHTKLYASADHHLQSTCKPVKEQSNVQSIVRSDHACKCSNLILQLPFNCCINARMAKLRLMHIHSKIAAAAALPVTKNKIDFLWFSLVLASLSHWINFVLSRNEFKRKNFFGTRSIHKSHMGLSVRVLAFWHAVDKNIST